MAMGKTGDGAVQGSLFNALVDRVTVLEGGVPDGGTAPQSLTDLTDVSGEPGPGKSPIGDQAGVEFTLTEVATQEYVNEQVADANERWSELNSKLDSGELVGSPGPEGPQGDVGPEGAQGMPGVAGPDGPTGPQGPQGDVGPQGPAGPQGPGSVGEPGEPGATGPQGAQGAQGAQGSQGDPGPAGATGTQGAAGAQGAKGDPGTTGAQGSAGAPGQGVPAGGAAGQVLKKTAAGDYATGWQNDTSGWTIVRKSADESVNSATIQDDDHLQFATVAGTAYEVELLAIYACPAGAGTPDIKCELSEDATARGAVQWIGLSTADAAQTLSTTDVGGVAATFGTAAAKRVLRAVATHVGGGGTLKFKWAQNTTTAGSPTFIYTASVLRYRALA